MKPIFVVNSPKVISSLEEEDAKTVGALHTALSVHEEQPCNSLSDGGNVLLYEVKGDDGVSVPLNGPDYDASSPLPPAANAVYHISARPAYEDFTVPINLYTQDSVNGPSEVGHVLMRWTDNGIRLKEKIEAKWKIPFEAQRIQIDNLPLNDTSNLLTKARVQEGTTIMVTAWINISFDYRGNSFRRCVNPHERMAILLSDISDDYEGEDAKIRFSILKSSGFVARTASKWLADRTDLFACGAVVGSWRENGLRDGDKIKVYRIQEEVQEAVHKRRKAKSTARYPRRQTRSEINYEIA